MRPDNRQPGDLRPMTIQRGFTRNAPGSVMIATGETKVFCTAMVEEKVPPFRRGRGGWVTAEYAMLPGSTNTRKDRESARGRLEGRTQEISRLIGRSMRAAVDIDALGERTIWIDCDVIQADGGTRTAAITGAGIARVDALRFLQEKQLLTKSPLIEQIAAVSVAIVDGTPVLDVCYTEDVRAEVDMNVVMTAKGEFIEVQGTAEGKPFGSEHLNAMLALARDGIGRLAAAQNEALETP